MRLDAPSPGRHRLPESITDYRRARGGGRDRPTPPAADAPGARPPSAPPPAAPRVMVVNKSGNKFTYFTRTPNVKELQPRTPQAAEVELIVRNQDPLQIELWVSTE